MPHPVHNIYTVLTFCFTVDEWNAYEWLRLQKLWTCFAFGDAKWN